MQTGKSPPKESSVPEILPKSISRMLLELFGKELQKFERIIGRKIETTDELRTLLVYLRFNEGAHVREKTAMQQYIDINLNGG